MSLHGVEITAQKINNEPISEDELERIFVSLESNMAIRSVNVASDLDAGKLSFLFGVDCPTGLDPESLVPGIVDDALEMALGGAQGSSFKHAEPVLSAVFC